MSYLILGLILFLGAHSVRIFAEGWRTQTLQRLGEGGFGQARQQPVLLWSPPAGMRHLAALLMLASCVLLTAAYVPGNQIKARLRHPMVLGVKAWALAHLLANGQLLHVVLFGAFLLWAVFDFRAARQRDRLQPTAAAVGTAGATGITVAIGVVAWLALTLWLHGLLIGVRPLG